jgi:hypothetical protein
VTLFSNIDKEWLSKRWCIVFTEVWYGTEGDVEIAM